LFNVRLLRKASGDSVLFGKLFHSLKVFGTAGEEAKDDCYLTFVNDHGGEFIPLVCETIGV